MDSVHLFFWAINLQRDQTGESKIRIRRRADSNSLLRCFNGTRCSQEMISQYSLYQVFRRPQLFRTPQTSLYCPLRIPVYLLRSKSSRHLTQIGEGKVPPSSVAPNFFSNSFLPSIPRYHCGSSCHCCHSPYSRKWWVCFDTNGHFVNHCETVIVTRCLMVILPPYVSHHIYIPNRVSHQSKLYAFES